MGVFVIPAVVSKTDLAKFVNRDWVFSSRVGIGKATRW